MRRLVFGIGKSQKQRTKNDFTVGQLWGKTLNLTLSSMICPGIPNGKISLYRDQILEPVVKPCLMEGHDFVLEENGDSGHGKAKTRNIVCIWKEEYKLE